MYTLKKLELEDGKNSMLPTGYSSTLPMIHLADYETEEIKPINSIQEVEEGWQVILSSLTDYHRTSKIREVVSKEEGRVVFKTQTSLYELTEKQEETQKVEDMVNLKKAQVGDIVLFRNRGIGTIETIEDDEGNFFPIEIKFEEAENTIIFMVDGKATEDEGLTDMFDILLVSGPDGIVR